MANLKAFKDKLKKTKEGVQQFQQDLQKLQGYANTITSTENQSISEVVLEAAGINIPLPTQAQVIAFYEEIGDPNNPLTQIDPKKWTNKQYLKYQSDVRKAQKEKKKEEKKDAKKQKEEKEKIKQEEKQKQFIRKFLTEFNNDLSTNLQKSIPDDLKPTGAQRLTKTISTITKGLLKIFLPTIINMIKNGALEKFNERKNQILSTTDSDKILELQKFVCPTPEVLDNIIKQRDGLVVYLNQTQARLTSASTSVTIVGDVAEVTQVLADTFKDIVILLNTAAKLLNPLIPGAVVSIINDIDLVRQTILFKNDGNPRIPPLRKTVSNVSIPLNQANLLITKIVFALSSIDELIAFCKPDIVNELTPLSTEVLATVAIQLAAQESEQGSEYKGFVLEIETRKYTDMVNQNRAVGKNRSGIVLVSGEWSFASDPNILLQEIKFIIDRDQLKAY